MVHQRLNQRLDLIMTWRYYKYEQTESGLGQADITPRRADIPMWTPETRITSEILDPMLAVALILEKDGVRHLGGVRYHLGL